MTQMPPLRRRPYTAVLLLYLTAMSVHGRLSSAPFQEERAKDIIEQVYRETRLGDGPEFWGEQYRDDIERYTRLFRTNYYTIFLDLKIEAAMARCAVNARHQTDHELWLAHMDRFDRAAEELDPRDKARYYFAKGLAKIQSVPTKLRELPRDFYKAAENGYSSQLWAEFVVKAGSEQTGFGTEMVSDVLLRFGESYRRGEVYTEAFKMYLLAAVVGSQDPELFLRMAEAAEAGGSHLLAYQSARLFLAVFDLHDGLRQAHRAPIDSLRISPRMPAVDVWRHCEEGAIERAIRIAPPRPPIQAELRARHLSRFDSRFATPFFRACGIYDDLFKIAICERYWADSIVVASYLTRISSSIDAHKGAIRHFAGKVASDPRFAHSPEIALWEARRWREARRLEEFAAEYPERYRLSRIGDN